MKVRVLASGSKGNCYLLENKNTCLVIEAGVPFNEVGKALNYKTMKICGCLITHEHKDHCGYIDEFIRYGIHCYMSEGTVEESGGPNYFKKRISKLKPFNVDEFRVMAFDTKHDCKEPVGFIIYHKEMGNLLFATDTYYLPNKFSCLNHILIECNYDKEILMRNEKSKALSQRIIRSHLSIDTCIEALKANDLSRCHNIMLIHLSDANSNSADFKARVESATGIPVIIAEKGVTVEFDKRE